MGVNEVSDISVLIAAGEGVDVRNVISVLESKGLSTDCVLAKSTSLEVVSTKNEERNTLVVLSVGVRKTKLVDCSNKNDVSVTKGKLVLATGTTIKVDVPSTTSVGEIKVCDISELAMNEAVSTVGVGVITSGVKASESDGNSKMNDGMLLELWKRASVAEIFTVILVVVGREVGDSSTSEEGKLKPGVGDSSGTSKDGVDGIMSSGSDVENDGRNSEVNGSPSASDDVSNTLVGTTKNVAEGREDSSKNDGVGAKVSVTAAKGVLVATVKMPPSIGVLKSSVGVATVTRVGGVTSSENKSWEVATAESVSEGVGNIVGRKMISEVSELTCSWLEVCKRDETIVCSREVDGSMLSKGAVDAGKLETSCRILLGNTSVVKAGRNASTVEVRDAKAGDVEVSRLRVDVGSTSKTCELETKISVAEVASGTSCGLVAGVSSMKEDKDVCEGEKSKVVKSSPGPDVMDITCEVSKVEGEGCSDSSTTWLETGPSRSIVLENPIRSLELASSILMVGVGKISTTDVLSISGGPDDASESDRDAKISREGAGVGVRRAIVVVLGSEGTASSMLVVAVGKISTDAFSKSVKTAKDSIGVSDVSRDDETCKVGAGVGVGKDTIVDAGVGVGRDTIVDAGVGVGRDTIVDAGVGVGRDTIVDGKVKTEDSSILVVASSATDETIAEDSTLSVGLGDKLALRAVERGMAAVLVSSNPMDDTKNSTLCVDVATGSLPCTKLGVGMRLTASVERVKMTEVAVLASADDCISSAVVTGRVKDEKALMNSAEKLDGSKFVKAVLALTTPTEDSVSSIPCVELGVGKGLVASAKDAGTLNKILATSVRAVDTISLLMVGSVVESTTEEFSWYTLDVLTVSTNVDISGELSMVTEEGEGREDVTGVWVVLVCTAGAATVVLITPTPKVSGIVLLSSNSVVDTALVD